MKTVKLRKTHTDGGREHQPGDILILDDHAADYIVEHLIGDIVEPSKTGAAPATQKEEK